MARNGQGSTVYVHVDVPGCNTRHSCIIMGLVSMNVRVSICIHVYPTSSVWSCSLDIDRYSGTPLMKVQTTYRDPSNSDTLGIIPSVLFSEVS